MKLIFTGSQSTGKTTILNYFKDKGYNCITEVVRNLNKDEGVAINEDGDLEGQKKIFATYLDIFNKTDEYISDRGLTDVLAYSIYLTNFKHLYDDFDKWNELCTEQGVELLKFKRDNDVLYCYFPIEFDVVKDGVRSEDEGFRKQIDMYIKDILDSFCYNYITVTGSTEERIKIIEEYIEKYKSLENQLK